VAQARADVKARLAEGEPLNVAPMWYLNVCWTEKDMALKEFPGILRTEKPTLHHCWDQDTVRPIYCAGGTPYEQSMSRILREISMGSQGLVLGYFFSCLMITKSKDQA
jgi:hypothetical protein